VLGSATVTIYLAGTTTAANVYEASSGGDSVTSVISDSNGRWTFYADVADYAFTQEYKVVVTKDGYSTITLDNIFNLSLPTDAAGSLINDGLGAYSWGTPTLASTATALAANGANCSAGTYPLGVDASGAAESCTNPLDTPTFILADDSTLTLPGAASGYTGGLLSCDTDGTCDWTDPSGITGSYVPLSTFTAAGDVPVGSGSGTVTVITKGANNTFFGVNNAGTLGFHASFNPVLVSAPVANLDYSGTVASFTAGEALSFGDVVYCRRGPGGAGECATTAHCCYKYDADDTTGTPAYKTLPPRAMVVSATINKLASGTFLLNGIIRKDTFAEGITNDQDEGAIVYGSVTAGAIELTKPAASGDAIAILGYMIEEKVLYFNPSPILAEAP
jgi:hypothetical protein